jgi:hypothetical protein
VQRRAASDRDRDEHGVVGASAAIIVAASNLVAGDTVRAGESWKPHTVAQVEERSRPARVDIIDLLCPGRLGKHAGRGVASESRCSSE